MTASIEIILLASAGLLLLSVFASKTSGKLGVPSLLLFLVIGMLAGSDGPGGIEFSNAWAAQMVGVAALAMILFAGGLETDWKSVKPAFWSGFSLATLGVLLTAFMVAWFAKAALGLTLLEGLLLGSIVSSTDAAAVFSVLRSKNLGLKEPLKPLLELESGSNDPMSVFLTLSLISLIQRPETTAFSIFGEFVLQAGLGLGIGYAAGKGMVQIIRRIRLEYEGLYPVLTLSLVILTYSLTNILEGSGFLAVYVAGLILSRSSFTRKKTLLRFHDGLAWLMQIVMFLALGLLVYPSRLGTIAMSGLAATLFLMFVARPVSVFICLLPFKLGFRQKAFASWVGLRGAAPIVLSTFLLLSKIPNSEMLFNLVFFIVLASVLFQGTTVALAAKLLKVDSPAHAQGRYPLEFEAPEGADTSLVDMIVPFGSFAAGKAVLELELPKDSLIALVCRNEKFMVPSGNMILEEGDVLLVLADASGQKAVQKILSKTKSDGPPPRRNLPELN